MTEPRDTSSVPVEVASDRTGAMDDRRSFLRRAAAASVGAAAVASVAGAESARADGGTPAYTDASNTFTKDQRIDAGLGIGQDPTASLSVLRLDSNGPAVRVNAFG